MTSVTSGLPVRHGMGVYALTLGILVPLLAVAFAARIDPRRPKVIVAGAVLGAILAESIRYSFWPISQNLAILLFQTFLGLIVHMAAPSSWTHGTYIIPLFAMGFAHKIPLAITVGFLLLFILYSWERQPLDRIMLGLENHGLSLRWVFAAISFLILGIWTTVAWLMASPTIAVIGLFIGLTMTASLLIDVSQDSEELNVAEIVNRMLPR